VLAKQNRQSVRGCRGVNFQAMERVRRGPVVCKRCRMSSEKQADSVYRCKCGIASGKGPQEPVLYYACGNILITIYSDGSWEVEPETTTNDLKEYLLSLPDRKSPAETLSRS
jgi:hypothetical protein